jgi:putative ABC transport system substrate-binding protein
MKRIGVCIIVSALHLAGSLSGWAQQAKKVYRLGVLEVTSTAGNVANFDAFRQGLRELGYVEGQNLTIEYRSADGRSERFPEWATELAALRVDLIVTRGTTAALAAKNASGTIPVVMAAIGEPIGSGVIASLARPGGNVTGLSAVTPDVAAKRVELLKEVFPRLRRVAALFNMSNPVFELWWKEIEMATRSLGLQQPQLLDVRKPDDLQHAFEAAVTQHADALVIGLDTVVAANRQAIVDLARSHRLLTIFSSREFVEAGGLISYGVSYPDLYRRAATYVDKILKGAKPGDLPVEQPTKFELVINLKTAKQIGVMIPPNVLARADRVIR